MTISWPLTPQLIETEEQKTPNSRVYPPKEMQNKITLRYYLSPTGTAVTRMEGIYVYLRLNQTVLWQKPIQHCKAIILQSKNPEIPGIKLLRCVHPCIRTHTYTKTRDDKCYHECGGNGTLIIILQPVNWCTNFEKQFKVPKNIFLRG